MTKLEGKSVLITGGSKGIGLGVAKILSAQGMNVAITSRHIDESKKEAEKLQKQGNGKVLGLESDVRNLDSEMHAVEQVMDEWGQLDVLIANAGVGHFGSIEELTENQWEHTIDTNLTGVFNSVKAALPYIIDSQGYIITIASLAGTNFFKGGAAYNASKFGLVGFSQAIMLDLRDKGVKVSTIMPGSVSTHFNGHQPDESDSWKIQPEDIGILCLDLLKMHPRTLPSKVEVRPSIPK